MAKLVKRDKKTGTSLGKIGSKKVSSRGGIKSVAVNYGGQTHIVERGSAAESKYLSQGGKIGTDADKQRERTYLKSLNKKGSPNYIPQEGDAEYVAPVNQRLNNPQGLTAETEATPPQQPAGAAPTGAAAVGTPQTIAMSAAGIAPPPGSQAEMLAAGAASGDPVRIAASRYSQAAQNLPGGLTGTAPADTGQARGMLSAAIPQQPDTAVVDSYLQDDPVMANLMSGITQLLNPKQQTTTLVQDYKKLYAQSGLDDINEEIIDAETIINGTEDDIRNEVQMAGGMATESQVQAMSLARNKSLLTRYNQLVQMKTDATNQLNTMMSLNAQDKQMAQTRVNQQISNMFNLANFRQQAQNNVREQYQWLAEKQGADGLYNALSQDPRQLAFAEKILGVGAGGLKSMAGQAAQQRLMQQQEAQLDLSIKRQQLGNLTLEGQLKQQGLAGQAKPLNILQAARAQDNVQTIGQLAQSPAINSVVGPTALSRGAQSAKGLIGRFLTGALAGGAAGGAGGAFFGGVGAIPGAAAGALLGGTAMAIQGAGDTFSGESSSLIAGVEQLRSQLNLDTLIEAKAKGATFGALSDQELRVLSNAATKLGSYAVKDSSGDVIGYRTTEGKFREELDKINYFAKLDYVLKGGSPADVGVIENPDGTMWVQNSDGTLTPLQ